MASTTQPSKRYELQREKVKDELLRRQLAEKSALDTVMTLLESGISESHLIASVERLTPQYYKDVTEERGLALICGYPLCNHKLKSINHKQKYHISTNTNKVYDVTERKYFCSSNCYKASKYLESQISEEPLWSRGDNFKCDITLLKASNSQELTDESVVIDKNSVYLDPTESQTEQLANQMLENLHIDDETQQTESILSDDRLSEESSDEEPSNQQPAEQLLKSRMNQRLNIGTGADEQAASASVDTWVGSMLTRQAGEPTPSTKATRTKTDAHKHKPSAGKPLTVKALPTKATEEELLNRLRARQAAKNSAMCRKTVMLDSCLPAPSSEGGLKDVPKSKTSGCVQVCINRLSQWFTDETRRTLLTLTNGDTAHSTNQIAPSQQVESPLISRDEVEIGAPNVESVLTKQRNIVYHRLLKSLEKVSRVLPEDRSTHFIGQLTPLIKTFRLDKDNIVSRPLEWNIITLILIIRVHRFDVDVVQAAKEEIDRLTNSSQADTSSEIQTFLDKFSGSC